jgi:hypothetical protein
MNLILFVDTNMAGRLASELALWACTGTQNFLTLFEIGISVLALNDLGLFEALSRPVVLWNQPD